MPARITWDKKVVTAKPEPVYGTDSLPVAGTNAIQTVEGTVTPIAAEEVEVDVDNGYLGNNEKYLVGMHSLVEFKVPIAGSGTAGDVPGYGVLHRMCGLAETIDAGVDVRYNRVVTGWEAGTIKFNHDGIEYVLLGSRGNLSWELAPNNVMYWMYRFLGLFVDPATVAFPTPTLSGFKKPVVVSNANTAFDIFGFADGVLRGWSFDMGNDVQHEDLPGNNSVDIVNGKPQSQITFDEPPLATHNFYNDVKNRTQGAFNFQHGTVAGNIFEFQSPAVELGVPSKVNSNGKSSLQMGMSHLATSPGNDFLIIIR